MRFLLCFAPLSESFAFPITPISGSSMDAGEKSRHAARAAILCLMPGLGHLYIGEKRGYAMIVISVLLLLGASLLGWPAVWLYLGLVILSIWDTCLIVKRDRGLL